MLIKRFLRGLLRVANLVVQPLGVRVERVQPLWGSLDLYPENGRPQAPTYVNIGAGDFFHPYWHNLDTPNDFYANSQRGHIHIEHDLASELPMPFGDSTLRAVYMSHVIEHLSDQSVQRCFAEVHRCLQPGGYFRITAPDIDLEYDAYRRGDISVWMWPTPWGSRSFSLEQRFLEHFATPLTYHYPDPVSPHLTDEEIRDVFLRFSKEDALNHFMDRIPAGLRHARPENHINWFNIDKIREMLRSAGFEDTYESRYGQSKCPWMRNTLLFDSTVPEISLYIECQK